VEKHVRGRKITTPTDRPTDRPCLALTHTDQPPLCAMEQEQQLQDPSDEDEEEEVVVGVCGSSTTTTALATTAATTAAAATTTTTTVIGEFAASAGQSQRHSWPPPHRVPYRLADGPYPTDLVTDIIAHSLFWCPVCRAISPHPMKLMPRCLHRVCLDCLRRIAVAGVPNLEAELAARPHHTQLTVCMNCPLCRMPASMPLDVFAPGESGFACRVALEFSELVAFPCLNHGCPVISNGQTKWRAHAATCPHECIVCPYAEQHGCTWIGTRAAYQQVHVHRCMHDRCPVWPFCGWKPNEPDTAKEGGGVEQPNTLRAQCERHGRECGMLKCIRHLLAEGCLGPVQRLRTVCPRLFLLSLPRFANGGGGGDRAGSTATTADTQSAAAGAEDGAEIEEAPDASSNHDWLDAENAQDGFGGPQPLRSRQDRIGPNQSYFRLEGGFS